MTEETRIDGDMGTAVDAFQDLAKRAIATQTELSKRWYETYWHCQGRLQAESTELTELFKNVLSTCSPADQIGILQVWMKGVTKRVAQDLIFSVEAAKSLASLELKA